MPGLLDGVRAACRAVASGALGPTRVTVDGERLAAFARDLAGDPAVVAGPAHADDPAHRDPAHIRHGDDATTVAFVLTLDAVNFGSGWFPHMRKRVGRSGYYTIAGALADRFAAAGPWTAEELTRLGPGECGAAFGQDPAGPAGELMALFSEALAGLGRFLLDHHGGRFAGPVEAAGGSAEALVAGLLTMPFYRDVHPYRGIEVPFYKRAQITVADLALALGGEGLGRFAGLDRITMFADNLVPHVLRVEGVLRYEPALAAAIDAGVELMPGSEEEVEIRAAAVEAVERLVGALAGEGVETTAMALDELLWHRGRQPVYKATPRHRCRTVYY